MGALQAPALPLGYATGLEGNYDERCPYRQPLKIGRGL